MAGVPRYLRWGRGLGPRRLAGTNPRAAGTDLRTRLASPRCLGINPRALEGRQNAQEAAIARMGPGTHRDAILGARRAWRPRELAPVPAGTYYDSGWRRSALLAGQPTIDPATGVYTATAAPDARAVQLPGLEQLLALELELAGESDEPP